MPEFADPENWVRGSEWAKYDEEEDLLVSKNCQKIVNRKIDR